MLGRPIAVDILRHDMLHPERLYRRRGRLGAEGRDAQAAHVVTLEIGEVRRVRHHRFEEGHPRLEDGHPVPFDHRGEAPGVGEYRRSFRHYAGHPRHQRGADQIGLPRDPARIGDDEQRVAGPRIERHRHRLGQPGGIAMRVNDALGLAGRARGVDEEHRILGIDRQRLRRSPDRAHEILVGQRQQLGLRRDRKARVARLRQQRFERRVGQLVAPAVALLAPDDVGLRGVAHDDHRLDARRQRDEARGDRDAHARGVRAADPPLAAERDQRTPHAAHHVGPLDRDFARQCFFDGREDRLGFGGCQFEIGLREDRERGRHRHIIVECGVGIGVLERGHLRVAIAAVRSDDHPRTGIADAVRQSLVAEPAEHRRVDDAQSFGRLGPVNLWHDARHVERDAVARLQPQRLQRQRAFRGFQQQLLT